MDRREALKGLTLGLGYMVATPTLIGVLNSCQSTEQPWETMFFDSLEKKIVPVLTDVILPADDTPGGIDIDLPKFADMMIKEVWTAGQQSKFREGIRLFAQKAGAIDDSDLKKLKEVDIEKEFKSLFDLEEDKKEQVLNMIKADRSAVSQHNLDDYLMYGSLIELRNLLLLGYFSSEKIGKEVLTFDPIPGQYRSCMPVSEVGNSYAILG